jgi:hypothetical protein
LGTPVVIGILLVICTTEFSTCLNIVFRGNELEVLWKDEVLVFIRCCCATAVDGSSLLNGTVVIIATTNRIPVVNPNRFIIEVT